jgi:hypothetical protein
MGLLCDQTKEKPVDIETFFTVLYVIVDDCYKAYVREQVTKHAGAAAQMSDSEVLTVALAGQWRVGVPWQSERGLVRWVSAHGRGMFPHMLSRSQFNARVRWLWGAFIVIQQVIGEQLSQATDLYECVDSVPLPAFSNGQACREMGHWLWESRTGHGGTHGGFYTGDQVLASVTPSGVVTGWLVANADIDERWCLSAFLSARQGQPCLSGPARAPHQARSRCLPLPVGHLGAFQAVGVDHQRPYLADRGFNSPRWQRHWQASYGATVLSVPPHNDPHRTDWSRQDCRWLASHRQIIDTTFGFLVEVFGWQRLQAHSRWGQYTRIAAKIAAYHLAMFLNRYLGRPLHALATLLC